jgi:uncharacterized protein (TIGR02271 family)
MTDAMMTDTTSQSIRPGASVDMADGHLGHLGRVSATALEVVIDRTNRRLSVPRELIHQVRADGSILLAATMADVERHAVAGRIDETRGAPDEVESLELREERLEARKVPEETGRVRVRKAVEEVPRRLEAEAYYEDVEVEHVPIGRIVKEQESPREEDGDYIVPVYEEQLVLVKRLLLKEEIHIRRRGATERRLFEETVRRERIVVEDPDNTGRVREHYATARPEGDVVAGEVAPDEADPERPGFLEKLGRKVLE